VCRIPWNFGVFDPEKMGSNQFLGERAANKAFYSAAMSLHWHRESILNFFDNRSNASAESFNARIKLFRANQKGVRDTTFYLFRLSKLYA